ncbi:MAG: hypothetical protein KDC03_18295 [Flavobacteriales bacterium]|nr:hypothetical protein [Flavobacteriales bacterium]MCB0783265.1 hypothetical protein [Flavobacteriales bacterium]
MSILTISTPYARARIAGFLMALDAKMAGAAKAVAQQLKKGLLQQMFV